LDSLVRKKYLQRNNELYKPVSGNFSFEVYKFLDPHKISITVVASDANRLGVYHNQRVRRITPREAARLQGFPDSFVLDDRDDRAYHQLGNSVSVNVVKAVDLEVIAEGSSATDSVTDLTDVTEVRKKDTAVPFLYN
ncbi:MAG: DNA cytosine methyltransferase, partial [Microcoleus sp.]